MSKFIWKRKARGVPSTHEDFKRISRMLKDYSIEVYHRDDYYKNGMSVEEVSEILEKYGVKAYVPYQGRGRPREQRKRWKYTEIARKKNYRKWERNIKRIVDGIISHDLRTYRQGFQHAGKAMVKDIKNVIRAIQEPELAESTIKRKGSAKPLIETKLLLNSIKYRIIKTKGSNKVSPTINKPYFIPEEKNEEHQMQMYNFLFGEQ